MSAMVASQLPFQPVIRERDRAILATGLKTAVAADDKGRIGAPIQKKDDLLLVFEGFFDPLVQVIAQKGGFSLPIARRKVVNVDFGELSAGLKALGMPLRTAQALPGRSDGPA